MPNFYFSAKRHSFLLMFPLLVSSCALAQTPAPPPNEAGRAETKTVAASASRLDLALDQLSQGHLLEARVLLEDAIKRGGDRPEVNVLLAYLLEREGRASAARGVLGRVAASPIAAHNLARLRNVEDDIRAPAPQPINSSNQNPQPNAARSQAADARLSRLERVMSQMVNAARAEQNLSQLQWSEDLAEIARGHSVEMRDKNYFSHDSPTANLRRPLDRYLSATGNTPRTVAENIYRAWGARRALSEADVRKGQDSFLNSPGHRANILLPSVTRVGIGIAVNENGDIWITQMFDKPM